ncbi:MAG: protein kinase [Acidobacteriota bacterium]|nr:protein kinase [Acidobacteriota bacterium]
MKPIAPNTLLQNRYLIVHLIGKGGMGEVYLAVDQRLGSAMALKRTFFADDEMLGGAFEREARTLARLRHNVLPKVSDHFTEDGNQYLIMEHISGEDLSKRLETSNKPFPLNWVLFWADQLLDALNYLHSHEPPIIHRDIKPQNLKLTDENSIVLLDFGLSKNSLDVSRVSSTGSVVGYTPHYAPMEQIRGTGTNPRSDLYSLSATLYQLLTNQVPPDALSRADALLSGMTDPIKPINEINPEVSSLISGVILKGMEVSQDKRFANAREMQKALRDAYAQMQNQMAAQTVAFKLQSEAEAVEIPQSQLENEADSIAEVETSSPNNVLPASAVKVSDSYSSAKEEEKSVSAPQNNKQDGQDFDATLAYDPKPEDFAVKPSDVETEVLLAGSVPEIVAAQQDYSYSKENNEAENFDGKESFGETENFSPDATAALLSYGSENDKSSAVEDNFNATTDYKAGSQDAFTATRQYSREDFQTEEDDDSQIPSEQLPAPTIPAVKKKSGGKALFIAGGIGLLFLVLGIAGMGIYLLNSSQAVTKSTPTPTPEAPIEIATTPMPTVEAVSNTDVNSNSTSENLSSTDSNANIDSNTEVSNSNKTTDKPVAEKPAEVPTGGVKTAQPTPVKINPKATLPATSGDKPTVKPTVPPKKAQPTPLPRILP